eukprot:Pompholyxophrys_punicea_v1_NODE_34_length_4918_cov_64.972445.p1 type:complete len:794 gc:universal NODE_34_length_4918_cov_64.972445:3073-692(-)
MRPSATTLWRRKNELQPPKKRARFEEAESEKSPPPEVESKKSRFQEPQTIKNWIARENENEHGIVNEIEFPVVPTVSPPIFEGAKISKEESEICLLKFGLRHRLSGVAFDDLAKLIDLHVPPGTSEASTFSQLRAKYADPKKYKLHYFCPKCNSALLSEEDQCPLGCIDEDGLRCGFYAEFLFEDMLQEKFQEADFYNGLSYKLKRTKEQGDDIADVYDGYCYERLPDLKNFGSIAVGLNTDGVPLYKKSKLAIWPIFIVYYDLSPEVRYLYKNLSVAALWFGYEKPNMNSFLDPICRDISASLSSPLNLVAPNGYFEKVKVYLLTFSCDLVAKALVLNSLQYNGLCGCHNCEEEGEIAQGTGNVRVFPYVPEPVVRTMEKMLLYAKEALETGQPVKGVKGPTILSTVPFFQIPWQVVLDYLHMIALGCGGKFFNLWFDSSFHDQPWSLRAWTRTIDKELGEISPTESITTLPRSIADHLGHWSAYEYLLFLLYYCAIIFHGKMVDDYYAHLMCLVEALHILLATRITTHMLQRARQLLASFCQNFERLYDTRHANMNIHLLCHLCDCVFFNGPLWVYSCFAFENGNGMLKRDVHGTFHIEKAVLDVTMMRLKLHNLLQSGTFSPQGAALRFLQELDGQKHVELPPSRDLGNGVISNSAVEEGYAPVWCRTWLTNMGFSHKIYASSRITFKGKTWTSLKYLRNKRRFNSCVSFHSDCGIIHDFYTVDQETFAVIQVLIPCSWSGTLPYLPVKTFMPPVNDEENFRLIPIRLLKQVLFCMTTTTRYFCWTLKRH